jgi:hypothetical protein
MTAVDFIGSVVDALNQLNIPFMLVGSFSSNLYGVPRSTKDADFVIQLDPAKFQPLVAALTPEFEVDPQVSFETITSTTRYRMRHRATAFLVELFELSPDPHDQTRFARRLPTCFAGRSAYAASPEDVVVTKLRWSMHGQRSKDVDDVRNVLAVQAGKLDLAYIRGWCDLHGTRAIFEQLLSQVAP